MDVRKKARAAEISAEADLTAAEAEVVLAVRAMRVAASALALLDLLPPAEVAEDRLVHRTVEGAEAAEVVVEVRAVLHADLTLPASHRWPLAPRAVPRFLHQRQERYASSHSAA